MAQGRPSQTLSAEEIEQLENFRISERQTFVKLNATMENPFTWQVLKRAMEGRPVWELNHAHIVAWIEQNIVAGGKSKIVSEGNDSDGKNAKL